MESRWRYTDATRCPLHTNKPPLETLLYFRIPVLTQLAQECRVILYVTVLYSRSDLSKLSKTVTEFLS